MACGGACVDTSRDTNNCGACGTACGAAGKCIGGMCLCNSPAMDCGPGMCVNVSNDPMNCGDCSNPCNTGHLCKAGMCQFNCQQLIDCANACAGPQFAQCLQDCKSKSTTMASTLWTDLNDCLLAACPSGFGQVCETNDANCMKCWSDAQRPGGQCKQALADCQNDP
jgi:hypothetical protein